jgi:2-keto-4-pentenoate hydratase/2-oxohepta-3-ene-1,7-dioic acid hydratase in catechol pathway
MPAQELDLKRIGAVYTIGSNYRDPANPNAKGPERPLVFGKAASSVVGNGATISWDRSVTANVDGEVELGVLIGAAGTICGYTIVNDVTSRDPWLDGDQWLLGKSLPGFCPVGPVLVPADELDPSNLRLTFHVNDVRVQDANTSLMRFSIPQIIEFLGRHVALREGDLISTGTPVRLGPLADRHLEPGDVMTCWIEGIGELANAIS